MPKKRMDLTGHVYGRLTVIKELEPRGYTRIWLCRCSCGQSEDFPVHMPSLRTGNTTSCGCIRKERVSAKNSIDLTDQVFGRLTAIEKVGVTANRKTIWRCECECGNITEATVDNLRNGTTKSCGCWREDVGKALQSYNQKTIEENSGVFTPVLKSKTRADNTSGVKGVQRVKTKNGYEYAATISIKGKTTWLGQYKTVAEAEKARKRGEEKYHKPHLENKNNPQSD